MGILGVRFIALVTAAGVCALQSAPATAAVRTAFQKQQEITQLQFGAMLQTSANPEWLAFMAALAGAEAGTLRRIYVNAKKVPAGSLNLDVKKDMIFAGGKPTGIKIDTYTPFQLSFQGKKWVLNEGKSFEENQAALEKLLSGKSMGLLDLIVAPAHADEGFVYGGASAVAVGVVATAYQIKKWGGFSPGISMWFGVVGGLVGGAYGVAVIDSKNATEVLNALARGDISMSCTGSRVVLKVTAGGKTSTVEINRKDDKSNWEIVNAAGKNVTQREALTAEQRMVIDELKECKSNDDAAKILEKVRAAALKAKNAMTSAKDLDESDTDFVKSPAQPGENTEAK